MSEPTVSMSRADSLIFLFGAFVLIVGVRLLLIDQHGVQTPYWDDWGMGRFLTQSVTTGLSIGDFFKDANEHRLVFNRILTLLIFNANQHQWDPLVSMVVNSIIWGVIGLTLMRITLNHGNAINNPAYLTLVLAMFTFPLAMVNILWGIQTHTYTMVLFTVLGCWCSSARPFSAQWWFGIFSLAAAGLTLAGGSFAAFAVATVQTILIATDRTRRRQHLITLSAALAAGTVGLTLILIQNSSATGDSYTLSNQIMSFLRTMSWPNSRYLWPAAITALPILLLVTQIVRQRAPVDRLTRFALSLYTFVVIVALAIAYARPDSIGGPPRRYFDYLALIPLSSFLGLLLLRIPERGAFPQLFTVIPALWIGVFIFSIPWHVSIAEFTIKEHTSLRAIQENHVRTYLNTGDPRVLRNKPYQHVPYPFIDVMIEMLDELKSADTLPYLLQTPPPIEWHPKFNQSDRLASAFKTNGNLLASKNQIGVNRVGEDVFGSYNPRHKGVQATGKFESQDFRLSRPYAAIPVQGYLGYQGLSMKLVDVGSGAEYEVKPDVLDSKYAESWRHVVLPVPRGYYRIVAQDSNPSLWFAFATPRSVGRVSYYTHILLGHAHWLWQLGVIFILIALRKQIAAVLHTSVLRG